MRWRAMGGPGGSGEGADGQWATSAPLAIPVVSTRTGRRYLVGASYVVDPGPWVSEYPNYRTNRVNVSPPFVGSYYGEPTPTVDIRSTLSRPAALDIVAAALDDLRSLYDSDRETYERVAWWGANASVILKTDLPGYRSWDGLELNVVISITGPSPSRAVELGVAYEAPFPRGIVALPQYVGAPEYCGSYSVMGSGTLSTLARGSRDVVWRPDNPADNLMQPYGVSKIWFLAARYGTIPDRTIGLNIWSDSPCYYYGDGSSRPGSQYDKTGGRPEIDGLLTGRLDEDPSKILVPVGGGGRVQYRTGGGWAFSR